MKQALILALVALFPLFASCGGGAPSAAGAYTIDTASVEAELKKVMATMPAADAQGAEAMIPMLLESLKAATFELAEDGTFSQKMSMMGNDTTTSGTWKLEGEKITFNQTELNGQPAEDVTTGTFKDGVISMEEEGAGGAPMTLVFRKK